MNIFIPIVGSFGAGYIYSQAQVQKEKTAQQELQKKQQKSYHSVSMQTEPEKISINTPFQIIDQSPNYVSYYDKQKKIPIAVDETLTKEKLKGSADRQYCKFYDEPLIDVKFQSTLKDYLGAYQLVDINRGHMSAASNHKHNQNSMKSSFSLANILPQDSDNNQDLWNTFETLQRNEALENDAVRVISGPLFIPKKINLMSLKDKPRGVGQFAFEKAKKTSKKEIGEITYKVIGENNVPIPTHLYKILQIQKKGYPTQLGCFVMPNAPHDDIEKPLKAWQVPLEYIEKVSGIELNEVKESDNYDYCLNPDSNCNKTQKQIDLENFEQKIQTSNNIYQSAFLEGNMDRKKQKMSENPQIYEPYKQQFKEALIECENLKLSQPHWVTEKPCDSFDCYSKLNKLLFKTEISKEKDLVSQFIKKTKKSMKKCKNSQPEKIQKLKEGISSFRLRDSIFRQNIDVLFPPTPKPESSESETN